MSCELPPAVKKSNLTHPKYRADIDGLRAVAILSVVIFHALPNWISGGFIGVDIFFVISGFLISSIIYENLDRGSFSFTEFYSRRIKRIFPALILVLVVCFGFGWFALSAREYEQLGKHIFAGGVFLSNFAFLRESGYFDTAAESKPLLNLWSLGIEEQFYIVWPLLLYFAWKRKLNLLYLTLALAGISFVLNVVLIITRPAATFYLPITRIWELSLGGALAYLALHKMSMSDRRPKILGHPVPLAALDNAQSLVGTVLIGLAAVILNRQNAFPGWWALLPTIGACLIISAGPKAWLNRNILSNGLVVWFGLISYPLYLWHWPLLSFLHIIEEGPPPLAVRVEAVLMAIALAWLTLRLVEKPIRVGGNGKAKVIVLTGVMVAISSIGLNTYIRDGLPSRSEAIEHFSQQSVQLYRPLEHEKEANCRWSHAATIPDCAYLTFDKAPTVALIGDSHAVHLAFGLSDYYRERGDNLVQINACMILMGVRRYHNGNYDCEYTSRALDYATATDSIKTIILSFRGVMNVAGVGFGALLEEQFTKQLHLIEKPDLKSNEQIFREAMRTTLEYLVESGKQIIFIVDVPELGFDPKSCIARPLQLPTRTTRVPCAVERSEFDRRNATYIATVNAILRDFPTVKRFYPSEYLCDDKYCWGMRDGKVLYYDRDHLSYDGSMYIGSRFSPK